jgi:hypothetical protein
MTVLGEHHPHLEKGGAIKGLTVKQSKQLRRLNDATSKIRQRVIYIGTSHIGMDCPVLTKTDAAV